jgi:WD40 repeat protein
MNSFWFKFLSFFVLVCLTACGQGGSATETPPVETQIPVRTEQRVPAQTATTLPTAIPTLEPTPSWTSTITSTGLITTVPTITTTIMAAGTPNLTPGVEITSTPVVSLTQVIITTTVLTKTWTFSDVQVTGSGSVRQVAWKQDGGQFAVATSAGLFLYNTDLLEMERSFNVGETVQSVAFGLDEDLLVSGGLKGDIQWWFPDTGKFGGSFEGGLLGITSLVFPYQIDSLISGSDDGTVRVWVASQILNPFITEYEPKNLWHAADRVTSVDINPNFQIAAAGSYKEVSIWNLQTGEPVQTFAVADSSNHLRLWNTGSWELTHDIPLDGFESISALDFSPNGMMIALGSKTGKVMLWNLENNTLSDPETQYPFPVTDVAFHPREPILISSYRDGLVRLWSYQP